MTDKSTATSATQERCTESWRLSEELRLRAQRLAADPSRVDLRESYDHLGGELRFHHATCPRCRMYFRSFEVGQAGEGER